MKLSLIAAVDRSGLLCDEQGFLWHLPKDVEFFRHYTSVHPNLLVGRTTYEQMLGWFKPEHQVIVLSRNEKLVVPEALGQKAENVIDAIHAAQSQSDQVWVCLGGALTYQAFLPYASDLYLTWVEHDFEPRGQGTYFPQFMSLDETWECLEERHEPADALNAYPMSFRHYQRRL